ncbi:hypothetical protein NZL82_15035 [Sphingomonas sanguinis]|uniref:hypothetical protein n=1 Tax=Sphingomonas sp. LC-1 TaxID=3110957 RepID=UPI0021BB911B|nr:hypothetical protein [Sphingomonas sp. LC-1]MCT8003191.1 hypothetical protein [Sphingomonas sp. LC-1]
MRGALTLRIVAALVPVLTSIATVDAAPRPAVLEATTKADWQAAGLDGTGCYWSPRRGGSIHFVAAGNTAMIKVRGRIVVLKPRRDAKALFPFTHDAWRSGDLTIRVVDTARIRAMGYETVTTDAALIVTRRDATIRLRGSMICGS